MRFRRFNDEVLFSEDRILKVGHREIEYLKEHAALNQRRRIRLCAHKDPDDQVHEMLIVHSKNTYVRPHKHLTKSESFHIIEGCVDVIIFSDAGKVIEVVQMGDYLSGRKFFYMLSEPLYHTLIIHSQLLVFHESTNGPFRKSDLVCPTWAPDESDEAVCNGYLEELTRDADSFLSQNDPTN